MIRVCHIVNLITGRADGVYTHLKMIFQNSDKTKFQHYLIFQGGENIEQELSDLGVKVFVSTSLKKKISIRAFADIYTILKDNNINIVHVHLLKPYAISGLVNIILRKKFIFNYHGIFLKNNPYYNFFEKNIYSAIHYLIFLFGKVDTVLVPSIRSRKLLTEETKLFPEPIIYYNGYTLHRSESEPNDYILKRIQEIKKNNLIIAVIGRLEIQKRIDRAIDLFKSSSIKRNNLSLLIFGDGNLKGELSRRSKELGIESRVILFDYVAEVLDYFKYIDILLFTSDWEGMPLTMWEAMGNKVPLIAPDVGGFKEILEENKCGLIYEAGSMIDAEEKLISLIDDEQLRKNLGENGRMVVETKYNEKKFIRQIEQIYFDLLLK
jgi:glycosyltransferase involved in cell wall biosynthesis